MLFRKLFRLLVLGGVMVGSATGCGSAAQGQAADDKKPDSRDGGSPDDGGTVFHEIRSCLYPTRERPAVTNFIIGLGGRDISIADCTKMLELTEQAARDEGLDGAVTWLGLRE